MSRLQNTTLSVAFISSIALGACATQSASQQLTAARTAYQTASTGPAATEVPNKLHDAKVALDLAERAHEKDARSDNEENLAYIAERKAILAQVAAAERIAVRKVENSEGQKSEVLRNQRDNARDEVDELSSSLGESNQDLNDERQARIKAEEEAQAALESLKKIASIQSDNNRTVITLSGSVLFETNRAALLPIARNRLDTVAQALNAQGDGKRIQVLGYTDSQGSDSHNMKLSQDRAEAVTTYLSTQGLSSSRMEAIGKGESNPISSNQSSEGRANNRRVEIIIENANERTAAHGG